MKFIKQPYVLRDDITLKDINSALFRLTSVIDCNNFTIYEDTICHVIHLLSSRVLDKQSKHYDSDMTTLYHNYGLNRDISYQSISASEQENYWGKVKEAQQIAKCLTQEIIHELEIYKSHINSKPRFAKDVLEDLISDVTDLEPKYVSSDDFDTDCISREEVLTLLESYK